MKITDRLKVEHGVFLVQLRRVERLVIERAPAEAVRAALETITEAEAHHSRIEDRLLYPALARKLGADAPPLQMAADDHRQIDTLLGRLRAGATEPDSVLQLVTVLRDHMEREIHGVFVLAEEVLPEAELHSMSNWDVEHIFEESGNESLYVQRLIPLSRPEPARRA